MASSLTSLLPPTPDTRSPFSYLRKPTTQPVPRNTSPYSHIHTPLVLLYYVLRFNSLVPDPLQTMVQDLVPVILAQCVFCATCLPAAGTWGEGKAIISGTASASSSSQGKPAGGGGGGATRRKGPGTSRKNTSSDADGWGSRIAPTILSLILTLTVPPLPLALFCLILGAPLWPYSQLPHTLLLATHVSLLAFMPLFYTHGVAGSAWRDVVAAWLPFDGAGVWAGSVGCFVGGWLGAVPIALDWDREWQRWPCTVLVGVVGGWALGRVLTVELGLGIGRRIDLSERDHSREEEQEKED